MLKLSANGTRWLKFLHLFTVCSWVGGVLSLIALHMSRVASVESGTLYGMHQAIRIVDIAVIIPVGAFGCIITGLLYGIYTNWGFFKQKWLIAKWLVTLFCFSFGVVCLGPWKETTLALVEKYGVAAMNDPTYIEMTSQTTIFIFVQLFLLTFLIYISVFKPWKNKKA